LITSVNCDGTPVGDASEGLVVGIDVGVSVGVTDGAGEGS